MPKDLASLTSTALRHFLNSFDTVFCDLDGVVWNVGEVIPGIKETFQKLRQCGKKIGFVSNNSLNGTLGLHKNLRNFDSEIKINDIVIPTQAIISYLKDIQYDKEVFLLGSSSMKQEFAEAGLKLAEKEINETGSISESLQQLLAGNENIKAVVYDYDIHINYLSLIQAAVLLHRSDVIFITGATDQKVFVNGNLVLPGPGAFLGPLLDVAERKPMSFGKPSKNLTKFIQMKHDIKEPCRVLFVGDSISQDIAFGSVSGYQTLLVLTGVSSLTDVKNSEDCNETPKYYIDSLGSLTDLIENKLGL